MSFGWNNRFLQAAGHQKSIRHFRGHRFSSRLRRCYCSLCDSSHWFPIGARALPSVRTPLCCWSVIHGMEQSVETSTFSFSLDYCFVFGLPAAAALSGHQTWVIEEHTAYCTLSVPRQEEQRSIAGACFLCSPWAATVWLIELTSSLNYQRPVWTAFVIFLHHPQKE